MRFCSVSVPMLCTWCSGHGRHSTDAVCDDRCLFTVCVTGQ